MSWNNYKDQQLEAINKLSLEIDELTQDNFQFKNDMLAVLKALGEVVLLEEYRTCRT